MPISNHYLDNGCLWFTVTTPEYDLNEDIPAQHILSIDPGSVELYRYLHSLTLPCHHDSSVVSPRNSTRSLTTIDTDHPKTTSSPLHGKHCPVMNHSIQSMILDYFEVEHNTAALDLIENSLAYRQKPTMIIVFTLFDILLRKKEFDNQHHKENWIFMERTQGLLLNMLHRFGPQMFDGIWNSFRHFHILGHKKHFRPLPRSNNIVHYGNGDNMHASDSDSDDADDNMESRMSNSGFANFADIWDFIHQSFTSKDPTATKTFLLTLDILVSILEQDFLSKKDSSASIRKSIFLMTLMKNNQYRRVRLTQFLDILLQPFDDNSHCLLPIFSCKRKELSGRLLNMMIAFSLYDSVLSGTDLATQFNEKLSALDLSVSIKLFQYICFDTFILQLCDLVFLKSDWHQVQEQYLYLRNKRDTMTATVHSLQKWIHIVTKIGPYRMNWEDVHCHVFMVKQYYQSMLRSSTLRYDSETKGSTVIRGYDDVDDDSLVALLDGDLIGSWRLQVESWMNQCSLNPSSNQPSEWDISTTTDQKRSPSMKDDVEWLCEFIFFFSTL
ncbi:uncharacterized protein BX664DRAFT_344385 [Halteromyces radiatus]|uniref:uncharacterized protein n=1 Tax=Halteromyces radiatus TaxID=101107 RepID=UPI0022207227|nr:uncharacterized protein BX664DRAFT_344385 [Halteromyces radiatus]KAI8076325.1 hypothetical protein BX664DRAFT_344385 [Halteromyces radiatus]